MVPWRAVTGNRVATRVGCQAKVTASFPLPGLANFGTDFLAKDRQNYVQGTVAMISAGVHKQRAIRCLEGAYAVCVFLSIANIKEFGNGMLDAERST